MNARDELMQRLKDCKTNLTELPRNRETAIVGTKIDEAVQWLKAHIELEDGING